jgi:2'-5' RNA ligase
MYYGIVIFPGREIQQLANSYRKRYDPHYPLIPPHLTLKERFEIQSEEKLAEIVEQIGKIAESIQPFNITVTKISTFYPANNTIYLNVENHSSLTKLFEKLHEGILKTERPYGFVPHITIAQKLTVDELHDIYGSLKMLEVKRESRVDRIHLLYQLDDGTWTVYQTFLLGEQVDSDD